MMAVALDGSMSSRCHDEAVWQETFLRMIGVQGKWMALFGDFGLSASSIHPTKQEIQEPLDASAVFS
jgi:hypothetical protein